MPATHCSLSKSLKEAEESFVWRNIKKTGREVLLFRDLLRLTKYKIVVVLAVVEIVAQLLLLLLFILLKL